ncbi:protein a6 [Anastrepha obliqua]|uniref:protein a6 n=1 Tax=Anastrepha obliqua TaxID=95512 RepID=UPI0024099AC5|nr:protein a6 [Anastrepha obliqua]
MRGSNVAVANVKATEMESPNNNTNQQNASQKHSGQFYISSSLFDNKRLRQKRLRWAKALLAAAGFKKHHLLQRKKTERRKRNLTVLPPNITIDLLSDDDEKPYKVNGVVKTIETKQVAIEKRPSIPIADGPPPLVPISNLQPSPKQLLLSQGYTYTGQTIELSKIPNITLIPVQNLMNTPAPPPVASVAPMPRRVKRKRKSQQPKRHEQPTIVNNESIVLSDDSDNDELIEVAPPPPPKLTKNATNNLPSPTLTVGTLAVPRTTTIIPTVNTPKAQTPPAPKQSAYPTLLTPYSGQVDEEVTVSIVPRSSAAGTCPKSNASELFPMLPDETTVHTVIANRTYELSLTKLREGLASCGMPEFTNGQQKAAVTRRKGQIVDTPPMVSPPPAPISLKLSSDLSISLISDDEDDNPEQQQQQRLAAESLLQKQPQLMVQHLQLPAGGVLPSGANVALVGPPRLPPRRRKLG